MSRVHAARVVASMANNTLICRYLTLMDDVRQTMGRIGFTFAAKSAVPFCGSAASPLPAFIVSEGGEFSVKYAYDFFFHNANHTGKDTGCIV